MLDLFSEYYGESAPIKTPAGPAIADGVLDVHSQNWKMAEKVRVFYNGRAIGAVSAAEAAQRLERGEAWPMYRGRRLNGIVKNYRETVRYKPSTGNLIGQRYTHANETATNPARCLTLKRLDERSQTFRID